MQSGLIFDIKKYAINDGPGIRLTIFFKGCPLGCAWCHNPEGISSNIQKMYNATKCIGCKACIDACPNDACTFSEVGIITNRELCNCCGKCADICPTKATEMSGSVATITELMEIVDEERVFFDQSGGGVTISGGEPLLQPAFLIALLDELGRRSVHRTVDTTGFCKSELLLRVAERTDLFLYDLKHMDPLQHKKWTGVDNRIILENLQILANTGTAINIRIPLIKGINDSQQNIEQTATYVAGLSGGKKRVNILPFHNIGASKYTKLGETFDEDGMAEPSEEDISRVTAQFTELGLEVIIGG